MVSRESNIILRALVSQWEHLKAEIQRLNSSVVIRPSDGFAIFRPVSGGEPELASFDLARVVFNLPERADHSSTDLFVAVEGQLAFMRSEDGGRESLATHSFATKVAYFRRSANCLMHVYGAHYDFSLNEVGHPVFHGQMRSYPELAEGIRQHFDINYKMIDNVKGLLRTVRVPTAQMDAFSLFVQLCADHLLYSRSSADEKKAFNSLLQRSAFCQGAAFQVPRLETQEACTCYRARHWYEAIA